MGLGPWYRLGLSLGNCLILVAIIETALTFNSVFHGLGEGFSYYMYGAHEQPPRHLATDLKALPQYSTLYILYVLQVLLDSLLWLVIACKLNRHILLMWILVTSSRSILSAYLDIKEEWGEKFDGGTAINLILAFLFGSVLFLFKVLTGLQALIRVACDEDPSIKLHPAGQGFGEIRAYYTEHLKQLSVVLLVSEIAINVHRSFNYPITAFLMEAELYLGYNTAPPEYGKDISFISVIVNGVGLILISVKSLTMRRSWMAAYVITILIHFCLFVYVVIDWTSATAHPQMFNGYVFVSLMHLIYKVFILYIYLKSVL